MTWADIASFSPVVGVAQLEPAGWTIHGLPTNVYVTGGAHVVAGSLFGLPADVRFTPVAYEWNYGDGAIRSTAMPGASWAALGIGEFEPTATSHVYATEGAFGVTTRITYAAEYQFAGQPWNEVVGTLAIPTNALGILVGDAATVLVRDGCEAGTASIGC